MKMLLALVLLAGAAGGGLWYFGVFDGGAAVGVDELGFYTVTRGDLRISLTERGTLKTKNAVQIRSRVRGRSRIEWLIEEGAQVKQGDLLVEFEKTETVAKIEDYEKKILQLDYELNAAKNEETIQVEQNKTDVEKAQLQLEVANVTLKKLQEGDIPQETRRLNLAIETATNEFERARDRFETMPRMLEKDFITKDQYKEEELAVKTASEKKVSAEQALRVYLELQQPLDLKQARAAVTEAERNVERARKQADARLEAARTLVRQKTLTLESTQESLDKERANLELMTMLAPCDGTVFFGNPDEPWKAEDIQVGKDVYQNSVILTLPDAAEMMVAIQIHEADIRKVAVGKAAKVRSAATSAVIYDGEVTRIDSVANAGNRRWGDNIRRFKVEVGLRGATPELKPGTSAEVEIEIAMLKDVLFVPHQTVFAGESGFYCHVRGADGLERRQVELGRSSESHVEILSGVEEGDEVLLYAPDGIDIDAKASGDDDATPKKSGDSPAAKAKPDGDGGASNARRPRGGNDGRSGKSGRGGRRSGSGPGGKGSGEGRPRGGGQRGSAGS